MDLEQRVKVLEQEVDFLRNQLQTILLDIQEQRLVHQHPARHQSSEAPPEDAPERSAWEAQEEEAWPAYEDPYADYYSEQAGAAEQNQKRRAIVKLIEGLKNTSAEQAYG